MWDRPDAPPKCQFSLQKSMTESPHTHQQLKERTKVAASALDLVGLTPLVRLNRIPKEDGIECEVYAKCEYYNPCGSVKDRIALRMIEEGEAKGIYKPGDTLIEPTSGNTGLGLALVAAIKGYKCIIVMPEKMSKEKADVLTALGAEIVRTRTSAAFDDEDSHVRIAIKLRDKIGPTAHIPNQYINAANPLAHFDQTAEEILSAMTEATGPPRIDMVVLGAGTGGTLTGIAKKFKLRVPDCKIVGVDPAGSMLADHHLGPSDFVGSYDVEGIGYDFIPTVLDMKLVDSWQRTEDKESLTMARRIIRQEGLLAGGSSGAALSAALKAIKEAGLGKGHRVVVIFPDSVRNYMTKFLSDDWMFAQKHLDFPKADALLQRCSNMSIADILARQSTPVPIILKPTDTMEDAVKACGDNQFALVSSSEKVEAVFTAKSALLALLNGTAEKIDSVMRYADKNFKQLSADMPGENLVRLLVLHPYVVVTPAVTATGDSSHLKLIQPSSILQYMLRP